MKLRLSAVFALCLMFALASCRTDRLTGPNPPATVSDTIAMFNFNNNLRDATGNGHDGTVIGGSIGFGADRFGDTNSALIDESNSGIQLPNKPDLNFTGHDSFSISAWVGTGTKNCPIFTKSPADNNYAGYQLDLVNGIPTAKITNATGNFILTGKTDVTVTDWHFVVLTVSQGDVSLYVDSSLDATGSDATLSPELNNDGSPIIGRDPFGASFDGFLDEVVVYRHALDLAEVQARFHEDGWYEHHSIDTTKHQDTNSVWTPVSTGTSDDLVVGQFVNSTTGFVGGTNGTVLSTMNAGNTWNLESPAPAVSTSNGPGVIYGLSFLSATTGFVAADQRDISETTNGGQSWQSMTTDNIPQTDLVRSLFFRNLNSGFAGTADAFANPSGSICRSTDGGQTWNPIYTTHGGIYNIDFNSFTNNMDGVAQGRFGVNYWTSDGGATWNPGSTDQPNGLIARSTFVSATTGFAVVSANIGSSQLPDVAGYILRTDDAGHTWHTVYTVNGGTIQIGLNGIASNGAGVITAVGDCGAIVESTDNGNRWAQSWAGTHRWTDVRYSSQHHAVIFGENGAIAVRNQ